MEQLYTDFTTKMLPQIQEGLMITKDYFADLFGRYIQYLIISDAILLALNVVIFLACVLGGWYGIKKTWKWTTKRDDGSVMLMMYWMFLIFPLVFSFLGIADKTDDLIKDIYIPEVRIYQEIQSYRDNY